MARRWAEAWDQKVDAARPAADVQDTADRVSARAGCAVTAVPLTGTEWACQGQMTPTRHIRVYPADTSSKAVSGQFTARRR